MPGFTLPTIGLGCGDAGIQPAAFSGPTNVNETARAHRYLVDILAPLQAILLFAYKATRPVAEIDVITIHQGQDQIMRPGKNRWRPVDFTFYEVVEGNDIAAALVRNWWGNVMINIQRSSHSAPTAYLFPVVLSMLDGIGVPVWTYRMLDCWPSAVTPSELAYTDTDLASTSVTLQVNKVVEG